MPFSRMVLLGLATVASFGTILSASALEGVKTYASTDTFDDAVFEVENTITNRGLVIDYVAHIGEMLNRTAADVGATDEMYSDARILQFCSAVISRRAMEADAANIAYCPYSIFVFQKAGASDSVVIGCRVLPEDDSDASKEALGAVNILLDEIARTAVGGQ